MSLSIHLGCLGLPPYREGPSSKQCLMSLIHPRKGRLQNKPCCLHCMLTWVHLWTANDKKSQRLIHESQKKQNWIKCDSITVSKLQCLLLIGQQRKTAKECQTPQMAINTKINLSQTDKPCLFHSPLLIMKLNHVLCKKKKKASIGFMCKQQLTWSLECFKDKSCFKDVYQCVILHISSHSPPLNCSTKQQSDQAVNTGLSKILNLWHSGFFYIRAQ